MSTLLVDGYNLIHSHPVLSRLMRSDMESAREGLLRELLPLASPDYYRTVLVVFDAAGWGGPEPMLEDRRGLVVVFTRRRQSADAFIEAAVRAMASGEEVTVATSDRILRRMVEGYGAGGVDGEALLEMAREARKEISAEAERLSGDRRVPLEERVSPEVRRMLDRMRYR
ncbi:NYN domain-containing protein [Candidatus Solincola tengchongensis]|uniref:NYN domain-containing protein n=1 Tax=Candidatus Solincola tengchongensis TaxID=2900693 RepID=UPI00257A204D|nr:NYN domain-containing protein [Candidatus Solincola tengchongensis]